MAFCIGYFCTISTGQDIIALSLLQTGVGGAKINAAEFASGLTQITKMEEKLRCGS